MSTAKAPGPDSRPGRLDQVVTMLANRDSGGAATGEEAQKGSHRRRKAQIPHRVIKTTENKLRAGAMPVDSESDSGDDYHATAARSSQPMDESDSRLNGHTAENSTSAHEMNEPLPEGTVILQPEAAKDNSPYVGPEFGTTKSRHQTPSIQAGDSILNRTYKCTACSQQLCSLTTTTVKTHPMLSVLLCQTCFNFYESGEFDRDKNGYDEQCRWCGQGGNLICCDFCKHSFCKSCIRKNLGRDHLLQVLDADKWKCLCCNPKPLAFLMQECSLLVASITPAGGGGAGGATAHAGSASSDAVSRRPVRRAAAKPTAASAVASVASTPTAAGAKTPSASGAGSSGADSRKIAGKQSGNPAVVAANSKVADSSKQSLTTGGRPASASSKSSSSIAATAGVASSPAAASYSAAAAAVGRSMQVQASKRCPSATAAASSAVAPIIVPLGIVPRAAIRGSRTTFPELVHRLSESMIKRIKKKLVGLQPSNDVKLLVEEVSLEELSSPMSVRRRRLYEVPWERLGFAAPPPEPLRASALTTSGPATTAAGLTTSGTAMASPASAPAASPVQSSATATDAVGAAGKAPKPPAQRPPAQRPATGSGAAVGDASTQRPSAFLGQQQLSVDGMSIADIITKLKRRELTDAESTANRFLHTLEQAKVNFTELRKEIHAIKQAKIRHNQETMHAPTKRSGQQPQHFETEVALHARIRAALLDHLQVVYQICLSSTRPVGGDVPSVTPAAASAAPLRPPPPSPTPAAATEEDVTSDEYIDLIDYERMKKSGGQVASTPSLAGNAAPATGNSSKQDMHASAARSSPSTSAAGSSSVVKKGGSTVASAAAGTSKSGKGRKDSADNVASVGKHHVLVVDSDSNEDDTAAKKQSALQSPAATSADDTDGGNSTEASSSSRAGAAKKLPQKGKPGQPASAAHGDRTRSGGSCKPADSHSTAGRLQVDEDDDDVEPAEGKSTGKSAAASRGAAAAGNSVPPVDAPLGANDQAKLELLDDMYDMSDDDDDVNDGDDDNDEDYTLSHAKAKQRLTSSKRSQSAANRDVRIAVKRVGADGGSDSEPGSSAHKPADAAYVKLKLLNPLEIQSIRAELKLRAASRVAKVKKQQQHDSSSECGSRAEKQLRNLSRMVVSVKPEPSSNGDALQGQDEVSSTGDQSSTEGESKEADTAAAAAAAGGSGSTEVEQPKGVHKKSKKQCTANAYGSAGRSSLPSSEEASSDHTGSESDAVASDADGALAARSGEPAAGAGIGDDAANDSNKAALRSLLSEGLFDSSLEDVANSDSDEVQQPVKKRRRLASDEEGSAAEAAASDGDTRDNASRASGDPGGSSDGTRKATHPLLRKRLPQGVGYSDSGGEGGSPAAKGLGESEASLDDAESGSSAKQNLHETSNM